MQLTIDKFMQFSIGFALKSTHYKCISYVLVGTMSFMANANHVYIYEIVQERNIWKIFERLLAIQSHIHIYI